MNRLSLCILAGRRSVAASPVRNRKGKRAISPVLATLALCFAAVAGVHAQTITCQMDSLPTIVRAGGAAEHVGDLSFGCTAFDALAPVSTILNFSIFLSVNATSHITNAATNETEAVLLIDFPQPGVPNTSNGFPYMGQVPGKPGVLAGHVGSGNVYRGKVVAPNVIEFAGVPYAGSDPRFFQIKNIRGNVAGLQATAKISAAASVVGPETVTVTIKVQPVVVAFVFDGLNFTSSLSPSSGHLDLVFGEHFVGALRKRIENTTAGPLTAVHQDVQQLYCTESGFTPEFSGLAPEDTGSADTGTRLFARISNLPSKVHHLRVPNEVTSANGALVAHRVHPPFGPDLESGTLSTTPGDGIVAAQNQTADLLYEVTAAAPFNGINGCFQIDDFKIHAMAVPPLPLDSVVVTGHLAPIDGTLVASPTAPTPRFVK
jgi:hypothetical protein